MSKCIKNTVLNGFCLRIFYICQTNHLIDQPFQSLKTNYYLICILKRSHSSNIYELLIKATLLCEKNKGIKYTRLAQMCFNLEETKVEVYARSLALAHELICSEFI